MKVDIKSEGLAGLIEALASEPKRAKMREVVKKHAANLQSKAVRKVPVDTGNLKRSIQPPLISADGMEATVQATAEYAAYVELGTRFMNAQPFMYPALNEVEPGFLKDLGEAMKWK